MLLEGAIPAIPTSFRSLQQNLFSLLYNCNSIKKTNLVNLYAMGSGSDGVGNARQVFGEMSVRNVVTLNSLLAGYVRNRDIDMAHGVFNEMPARNVVSWTTMIAGCAQNGRCKQPLALFGEMQRANVELDQMVLVAVLSACAELGDLKLGRWVHSRTSVSWTSMIPAYAKQGRGEEALRTFHWMQCSGASEARPDKITFIGDASFVRRKMVEMGVKKPAGISWVEIDGVIQDFIAGDWSPVHGYSIYKVLGEILAQAKSEGCEPDI
ncbi:pentatricopeptide repeat (PPR) superfamily protein [Actinidia rufa]|uniref:Pentatricopeptide repeat (PPR) superfamily protein n=1 Tax=Actinidia rufa TaxID=165716 RepID=A0A7J0GMW3_9ERIC|nr:pentatricopeptide repeat (PPR) superfamily protein [Actinidia rufa]